METKILPLLSDGLRAIVINIKEKHDHCEIAKQLIKADDLINGYNKYLNYFCNEPEAETMGKTLLDEINSIITNECRMLSFRHNAFEISFLPKGKEAVYSDRGVWSRENRQVAKPARIIQKVLVNEFKCKEYEDFSNWIKNEMINNGEFILVSGSDITKYYNKDNYLEERGTLGNSCMRYSDCSKYFKLYEDKAKMLIYRKNDKIMGRAIVWELPEGTFMDRIYTCYDYLESQFIDYAEINGWYRRINNSLLSDGDIQEWTGPESKYKEPIAFNLTIQLDEQYECMPYVDSFRYYDANNNTISTDPNNGSCTLSNTDGSYSNSELYTCGCCEDTTYGYDGDYPDSWVYSEILECYLCPDCSVYCGGIDDYVSRYTETVEAVDEDGCTGTFPLSWILDNGCFVQINNKWYHTNCSDITFNEKTNEYNLIEE